MPLSTQLAEKSVQAAIAAIEIYNKPNFSYREESFALLMTNAWELLLKAKWLRDRGEAIDTLHEMVKDDAGQAKPKVNRSGNAISHGLTYLAGQMVQKKNSGLQVASHQNLLALVEIRDNAAHLMNADLYIARRVQEIGTASLKNYLLLIMEWFGNEMLRGTVPKLVDGALSEIQSSTVQGDTRWRFIWNNLWHGKGRNRCRHPVHR